MDEIKSTEQSIQIQLSSQRPSERYDSKLLGRSQQHRHLMDALKKSIEQFRMVCTLDSALIKNTPLIGLITYWMIEQVGKEMGDLLHSDEIIHIGINAPPELIGRGGIAYAIDKAGLLDVAHKITLEITERGLLDQTALDAINAKGLNCKIAVGDFGTGHANLLQLSKIEADIIKIDKAFIEQMTTDRWVSRMISGLSAFARVLGTELIAEGVESKSQVELLRSLGVSMGQGMYFSKPINAEAFLPFYKKIKLRLKYDTLSKADGLVVPA